MRATEPKVSINSLLVNLQAGIKALTRMKRNWVSVASLVGVAGLAYALKDNNNNEQWAFLGLASYDKEGDSDECWFVPGLQNLGNNCFLNVVLQALASCSCFQPYVEQGVGLSGYSAVEQCKDDLPLTVALTNLFKDLCAASGKRVVLSPRKVMLAMSLYTPNFNLTNQQDAAEAFLHLLSCLREEYVDSYLPNLSSLADVPLFRNHRIVKVEQGNDKTEQERWKRHYIGPFNGILGSILFCQSCSSQISLDFQFFHSLSLYPVLSNGAKIVNAWLYFRRLPEAVHYCRKVENYRCGNCWHIAAKKYLITKGANEVEVEHLETCYEKDSCDCGTRFGLHTLPWSNKFSCTLKQLTIARGPKILCIHIQRASINMFGELIKLEGHIKFPLIVDLLPFINSGVEIKHWKAPEKLHGQNCSIFSSSKYNVQFDALNSIYGRQGRSIYSKSQSSEHVDNVQGGPSSSQTGGSMCEDKCLQDDEKVNTHQPVPSKETHFYQLVSVVEHFGGSGGGHYTVYRSARADLNDTDFRKHAQQPQLRWFRISDSKVLSVSESEVLAAEASMLFYEKITEA